MSYASHQVRKALIFLFITVSLAGVASTTTAPRAHAAAKHAQITFCTSYYQQNYNSGFWDAAYEIDGDTTCGGAPPRGYGYLYPCSNAFVTENMDIWLQQSLVHGVTRLAESGRTGWETWAPDCKWHSPTNVWGYGQYLTQPLYACMWVDDQTADHTFDYLCVQDY